MTLREDIALLLSASALLDHDQQITLLQALPRLTEADLTQLRVILLSESTALMAAIHGERSSAEFAALTTDLQAFLKSSEGKLLVKEEVISTSDDIATLALLEASIATA